jgi:hypothetical protein
MYPFAAAVGPRRDPRPYFLLRDDELQLVARGRVRQTRQRASLKSPAAEGSTSMSINNTAAQAALLFAITLVSGAASAQGAVTAKRPTVGGKPIVQVKPTAPTGCKLVGTVKGTKLWAGECMAPPELRTTTHPEDKAPTPSPETQTVPKGQE